MSLIPSVILHATMAFAVLRHNGIEIGKADFWGAINVLRRPRPQPHGVTKKLEGIPQ
jgi:hypothetical protein